MNETKGVNMNQELPEPYNQIYLEMFKQKMNLVGLVVNADLSADNKKRLLDHLDSVMQHLKTVIGYIKDDIK